MVHATGYFLRSTLGERVGNEDARRLEYLPQAADAALAEIPESQCPSTFTLYNQYNQYAGYS